jgi:hypothetical protein
MTIPRIIGLYSSSPQAGKSTIANLLASHNYTRVSFADPLRELVIAFLGNFGYSEVAARYRVTFNKHLIIPELGVTPRQLLQTLGTEWGRSCVHPDVWTKAWTARTDRLLAEGHNVVCDDVRFPNEAALFAKYPHAELWRVHRIDAAPKSSHASDGGLDDYPSFDRLIHNNSGSIADLTNQISDIFSAINAAS